MTGRMSHAIMKREIGNMIRHVEMDVLVVCAGGWSVACLASVPGSSTSRCVALTDG